MNPGYPSSNVAQNGHKASKPFDPYGIPTLDQNLQKNIYIYINIYIYTIKYGYFDSVRFLWFHVVVFVYFIIIIITQCIRLFFFYEIIVLV